jgi:hypothetical protein
VKAVIVATALPREAGSPAEPAGLRPLLDRPFLQHVVERLVDRGARVLEVVACDAPEALRQVLGDGRRWGVTVRYHLARDGRRPLGAVKRAVLGETEPVLLARADRLWEVARDDAPATPAVYCVAAPGNGPGGLEWAGLAVLPPATMLEADDELPLESLGRWLVRVGFHKGAIRGATLTASCDTTAAWLSAQDALLRGRLSGLLFGGREVEPGVWLSRNVSLAPSARVEAPVYVGEDCRIEGNTVLGPGTVVGAGSVVATGASLARTLVLPGSYVGESVSLEDAVAGHGVVLHGRLGVAAEVRDPHLLGAVAVKPGRSRVGRSILRLAAGLLLVPAAPLVAAALATLRATGRGRLASREIVRLPAPPEPRAWLRARVFDVEAPAPSLAARVVRAAANLLALAQGRLDLVGVTPRTPGEIESLPPSLREVYLRGRVGVVTEASATLGPGASAEETLAADLAYLVSRSARRDLGIIATAVAS